MPLVFYSFIRSALFRWLLCSFCLVVQPLARAQGPAFTSWSSARQTVAVGQNLTLTASASGATSYQWKRNGRAITGAVGASYTIVAAIAARDSGWYQVVASNAGGSTASAAIFVNVVITTTQSLGWGYSAGRVVPLLGSVSAVAVSEFHGMALRSDGTVLTWGDATMAAPAGLSNVVAISCSTGHALALRSDGTVVAWGSYFNNSSGSGAAGPVPNLSDVVAIADSYDHSMALKRDGTVVVFDAEGLSTSATFAAPAGLTGVTAIAASQGMGLAVKSDGTVAGWGTNTNNLLDIPGGLSGVASVYFGGDVAAALKTDGTVVTWGNPSTVLPPPAGLANVVALALGNGVFYALKSDGHAVFWGAPMFFIGFPVDFPNVALVAGGDHEVVGVANAAGEQAPSLITQPASVTCALNQTVTFSVGATGQAPLSYQWERSTGGGSFAAVPYQPANYDGSTTATLTVMGTTAAMGGDVFRCVVHNGISPDAVSQGATLRVAQAPTITSPGAAVFLGGVAGQFQVMAIGSPLPTFSATGSFPAWATLNPATGLLTGTPPNTAASYVFSITAANGVGTPATQNFSLVVTEYQPPVITAVPTARQVVMGGRSLALTVSVTGATGYQWKRNGLPIAGATAATYTIRDANAFRDAGWYQLVLSAPGGSVTTPVIFVNVAVTPDLTMVGSTAWGTPPTNLTSVSAISSADIYYLALTGAGTVVQWGGGYPPIPTPPAGLSEVVGIWSSRYQSVALKSDGTVATWGQTTSISALPAGLANVVQLALGSYHGLAVKSDGTVIAWGDNTYGQATVPVGLKDVIAVAAGDNHSLALKADGTVVAWGYSRYGQATVPTGLTGVAAITASDSFSLAIKADGTVVNWGFPYWFYNTSTPPIGLRAIALFSTTYYALALQADDTVVGWGYYTYGQYPIPVSAHRLAGLAVSYGTTLVLRDATVNTAPTITTQPVVQVKSGGQTATFSVGATASTPLSYQWQHQAAGTTGFTDLATSGGYDGVTTATLTVANVTAAMNGELFRCVVTDSVGASAISASAALTVNVAPAFTSAPTAAFYLGHAGTYSVTASGLPKPALSATGLPGWMSFDAATGTLSGTAPSNAGGPTTFTLTATNGIGSAASQTFTIEMREAHSADTSPTDGAISLAELTRVIELYATRHGSVRTGAYVNGAGVDGFAADTTRAGGGTVSLASYHSADTNHDGMISLTELTRVIELYFARSGAVRTGKYHSDGTTEDGFAPGS